MVALCRPSASSLSAVKKEQDHHQSTEKEENPSVKKTAALERRTPEKKNFDQVWLVKKKERVGA